MSRRATRWTAVAAVAVVLALPQLSCDKYERFVLLGKLLDRLYDMANAPQPGDPKAAVAHLFDDAYLGAAAHLTGAADTDWRSDVELHNASDEGATVTLELLAHGADNSVVESAEVYLGPRRSVRVADVLASSFDGVDKAALRVRTSGGAVVATDRTYNLLGDGNALGLPSGATFGQYIPLRGAESAVSPGVEGRLIGLTHDDRARTNLGLVNMSPFEVRVRVDGHLADGTPLGRLSPLLAPFEYRQITRVFERFTGDPVADGYLVVRTTTDGGRLLAQASVVDAITGDPVFVPAASVAGRAGRGPEPQWIVAAAHVAGAAGTNWRTDLEVHNPNDDAVEYTVELLEINRDNRSARTASRTLAPGSCARHEDALIELFGHDGAAALRVVPAGGPVVVTSRTYNQLGAGNPAGLPPGATFGQFIPAVARDAAITPDCAGRMVHLTHDAAGDDGFRTNLVLVNATDAPTTVDVELHDADTDPLGSFEISLRPLEYKQLNNVFRRVTDRDVADGYAVVRLVEEEGAVFALASVVDNLSGDPVGMMATPTRSPAADDMIATVQRLTAALGGVGSVDPATLDDVAALLRDTGTAGIPAMVAAAMAPAAVGSDGGVVTVDFGDGTVVDDITRTGRIELDLSALAIDAGGLRGRVVERSLGYTADGLGAPFDELVVDLNLAVGGDGHMSGTVGLTGGTAFEGDGSILSGLLGLDTGICLHYPISGSVDLTTPAGETITIRFGPECNGTFEVDVEPAWDWEYRHQNPLTDWAHSHIVEVSNAHVTTDVADYWIPDTGGTEFFGRDNPGDTPPGVITYRFEFANPTVAAHLDTDAATYAFETSRGHTYLLASRDGADWAMVNDVPPPAVGDPPRNGHYIGPVPAAALGGHELWIRVELYAYGSGAVAGFTNTAQHARHWDGMPRDTFILQVACAGGGCGS